MQETYEHNTIEAQAQQYWLENQTFKTTEDSDKQKYYCLAMFPYPSGRLHMGHVRNYTLGDVIARYQRMLGKNVLQPMGWDAFGLPAENAAMKNNVPPAKWTYENIDYMRGGLQRLGFGYDWDREIATCHPEYYRWEQWFFTRLFRKGLVYKKTSPVNWCPNDLTVLANEQVIDGKCWRCDTAVERKEIPQWFMKITDYADELLQDMEKLPGWPEQVRTMQKNWIGKSRGLEIHFAIEGQDLPLKVFTTRPDTLMGVSYVAVAPEHPLAVQASRGSEELQAFIEECRHMETSEAAMETMEKKGVNTGLFAIHPVSGDKVPVFAANFVLMGYGEGAVMAVPAHDQRDWEFANKYSLPVKQVISPADGSEVDLDKGACTDKGLLINSGDFTGLDFKDSFDAIAGYLGRQGKGQVQVNYRLRDWGVSRQRYWGSPIPIINCPSCGAVPVPDNDLPVRLPEDVSFEEIGSPIKRMPEFYQTACPECGAGAERETDTFDTFMESSWYFARFACRDNTDAMLDERANYWLPVDQYVGGIEHAILHLLYARFYNKLLRDEGLLEADEPFSNLLTQGMVLKDGSKMSKSRGNTVDPQELIEKFGADTVRLFIMFAAPPEQSLEWSDSGVEGAGRFLKRLWAFAWQHREGIIECNHEGCDIALETLEDEHKVIRRDVHELLRQALHDFDRYQFNTVVSACMKILNILGKRPAGVSTTADSRIHHEALGILLRLLSPIAPHITLSLWRDLRYGDDILQATWPRVDEAALVRNSIDLVVQVNGKVRATITVATNSDQSTIEAAALAEPNVQRNIDSKEVKKIIIIPGKLVSIVVK
ncbi:MAG TPA: leucine--tRNA ligase [Gammaproteobacteria bacterium]|nr:leucine--tRNA ligase [Gammaproteobacteria bacterium]